MLPKTIHIGTSGWGYKEWYGIFYLSKNAKGMLAEYANTFHTVEVNNSFYRLPTIDTVKNWYSCTPVNFIFSCKASQYITHFKKLVVSQDDIHQLLFIFNLFQEKLGPILFQLPPRMKINYKVLSEFISMLPSNYQYTFEFRDISWFNTHIYDLLHKYQIALCIYDLKEYQSPEIITADFVYIRLHGPSRIAYEGSYSNEILRVYAEKIIHWAKEGKIVYCYFDNNQNNCAALNAKYLHTYIANTYEN